MDGTIVTCVLLPRLELIVAAGGRTDLLGRPTAVAPEPGSQLIGEVSAAAEAFGIHPGMRLGESLARCPQLTLVPPDPAGVADHWERLLIALESIGAAVEPVQPGLVCFDARGLLRLHADGCGLGAGGGLASGGLTSGRGLTGGRGLTSGRGLTGGRGLTSGGLGAVLTATRQALATPARFGVAPTRFAAIAAAARARVRRPVIVHGGTRELRALLAPMPVSLLCGSPELAALPVVLERLGILTLGELAALPPAAVGDRFGAAGLHAHRLASGFDSPLRPRAPGELVDESLELPEAADGAQLERALGLLIDRLLARRERRDRTLRAVVLSAVLVEHGGTWHAQVTFREALSDPARMRLALTHHLTRIPAPAQTLRLVVKRFGPATSDQQPLFGDPAATRPLRLREVVRLREAVRQARLTSGPDAALRILSIDPDSRLPERRMLLTPFEPDRL